MKRMLLAIAAAALAVPAAQADGGVRIGELVIESAWARASIGTARPAAAYLTIAVLYIANLAGVPMSLGDQLVLGFTVVALSVGVAALPSASLVMMVVILNQAGLPVAYMAIIVAVDRILDMARTSLNVTSDLVVAKTVDLLNEKRPAEAAAPAA